MARITIVLGLSLIALGVGAYAVTGATSITALIPAFFGAPFAILGWLGRDESRLKTTMHISAVVALLGLLGSARGLPELVALLAGGEVARPAAAVVQSLMAVACFAFLALAVRSFVAARRARTA